MPGVGPMGVETWIVDGSRMKGSLVSMVMVLGLMCVVFREDPWIAHGVALNVRCFVSVQV